MRIIPLTGRFTYPPCPQVLQIRQHCHHVSIQVIRTIYDALVRGCGQQSSITWLKTSRSTVRREFLPLLSVLHQENPVFGDPNRFEISLALGLSAEEHAALCNLPLSRKSTKALIKEYEDAEEQWKSPIINSVLEVLEHVVETESEPEQQPEPKRDSAQRTLF